MWVIEDATWCEEDGDAGDIHFLLRITKHNSGSFYADSETEAIWLRDTLNKRDT